MKFLRSKKYKTLEREFDMLMKERQMDSREEFRKAEKIYNLEKSITDLVVKVDGLEKELALAESAFDMANEKLRDGLNSLDKNSSFSDVVKHREVYQQWLDQKSQPGQ
jgi:predicted  nucleic acid-binding Zn-ribbon protein